MKKIKISGILLLIISISLFGAYLYYVRMTSDTTAPVIRCESEELVVSVSVTEEELLEGVMAEDDKSGDVSDTLVVENISAFAEKDNRIITYAAIDEQGNVGRCTRILRYTDYEEPTFSLTEPMRFRMGSTIDILRRVRAQSMLDGDLTDSIKYSLDSTIDLKNKGTYQVEFRVTDSSGKVVYLPIELEIYDQTEERISVVLSDYLIYVPLNGTFDPQVYYVGSDIEGVLTTYSDVDVTKAGVYTVDYTVTGTNSIGKSKLVVVVK